LREEVSKTPIWSFEEEEENCGISSLESLMQEEEDGGSKFWFFLEKTMRYDARLVMCSNEAWGHATNECFCFSIFS